MREIGQERCPNAGAGGPVRCPPAPGAPLVTAPVRLDRVGVAGRQGDRVGRQYGQMGGSLTKWPPR
ncbi:hypothetical protein GCM10010344_11330 [Streptomyces bluensis]|nr:hypothetical protein GCM10010344_11330 [Streptomyces bluensis]